MNDNITVRWVSVLAWSVGHPACAWVNVYRHHRAKSLSHFHYSNVSIASLARLARLAYDHMDPVLTGVCVGWHGRVGGRIVDA